MVAQYPHYLLKKEVGKSTQDENGAWVAGAEYLVPLSVCREETNGKGLEVTTAGGEFRKYSSLVLLPKFCPPLLEGAEVIISYDAKGSEVRAKGTVLKFDKGQLHCRLWL